MKSEIEKFITYEWFLDTGRDLYFKNAVLKQQIADCKTGSKYPHIYFYPDSMLLVLWTDEGQDKSPLTYNVVLKSIEFFPATI